MFEVNPKNRRKVGETREYPGSYAWPEYEYRCPVCRKWHKDSDVTEVHEDGTESYLCEKCAAMVDFSEVAK